MAAVPGANQGGVPTTTASAPASNSTFTAPAVQVVPSSPAGSSSTDTDAGGSTFPTAAVVIIVIICSLVGFFIAYKVYVWWYRRKHRYVVPLPEPRSYATPHSPGIGPTMAFADSSNHLATGRASSTFGLMTGAASMGRNRESSWAQEGSNGDSWSPLPTPGGAGGYGTSAGSSPSGPQPTSAITSRSPSPFGLNSHSPEGSVVMPTSASRSSFSSSAGARRHMMFGSNSVANAPHQLRSQASSSRLSGAPHAPHSRIDIVPPSPLGPPPGSVIAKSKASLDFAPDSGISGEMATETLIDVDQFQTSNPSSSSAAAAAHGYDGRVSAFEQGQASRAYSSLSGRSSTPDSMQRSSYNPRGRSSLGSFPTSPHRDPRHFASNSSTSSDDPSPNSSSTGLSSTQASSRGAPPPPIKVPSSTSPFPLSSNPTSPLEKLQQRIAQQARRSGAEIETSSGSGSSGGRASLGEVDGYKAPREHLEDVINGRARP